MALSGAQAGAAGASITCTTITGNGTGLLVISGCSGGVTGGASLPVSGAALAAGGTINWISGSSTTIAPPVLVPTSAKKCKVAGSTADKLTAGVVADIGDGIKVPGVAKGAVCIDPNLNISILKALKIK